MNPKVFVSHASEDHERFVLPFATKLRSHGIDAWVDKWEMLPGDSLVDKIFEEGIKSAHAIIVVLSKYSVDKRWVREELNVGMVKKINQGSKLIPVVIDDCEIPECLRSTVRESIKDTSSYDAELERIVMSVYGHRDKPALGEPPTYTRTLVDHLPGLAQVDSVVMRLACERAIETGSDFINSNEMVEKASALEIHQEELADSLDVLDRRGYVRLHRVLGANVFDFQLTIYGFEEYARAAVKGYDQIVRDVGLQIVNQSAQNSTEIMAVLPQPEMIVDHILDVFENQRLISLSKTMGGGAFIYNVSPELKRMLS